MIGQYRIWSERAVFGRRLGVAIMVAQPDGREMLAKPLEFVEITNMLVEPESYTIPPTEDGKAFLQALLDHAWVIGLRPSGFDDVKEQVAAMRNHLEDMRALVFDREKPTATVARASDAG